MTTTYQLNENPFYRALAHLPKVPVKLFHAYIRNMSRSHYRIKVTQNPQNEWPNYWA